MQDELGTSHSASILIVGVQNEENTVMGYVKGAEKTSEYSLWPKLRQQENKDSRTGITPSMK